VQIIRPYWEDWLNLPLIWTPSDILPLTYVSSRPLFIILTAALFWTIWTNRNKQKITKVSLSDSKIVAQFQQEVSRMLSARWSSHFKRKFKKQLEKSLTFLDSPPDIQKLLPSFEFAFLIPHHFIITSRIVYNMLRFNKSISQKKRK
jgi:hypothetical protein